MGVVVESTAWAPRMERVPDGLRMRSPADPFVEAMERRQTPYDRLVLATRALRRDEDCIEARLVVASHCDDIELRLLHLNMAVEAGETTWGSAAVRLVVGEDLGAVPGALPWLRSLKALGDALEEAGEAAAARSYYERLLGVDPADKQGVRVSLEDDTVTPAPGR
jgi:hypothetical protein